MPGILDSAENTSSALQNALRQVMEVFSSSLTPAIHRAEALCIGRLARVKRGSVAESCLRGNRVMALKGREEDIGYKLCRSCEALDTQGWGW